MTTNDMTKTTDHTHNEILKYNRHIRREIVLWFIVLILSFPLMLNAARIWLTVESNDYNRSYVAVNDAYQPMKATPRTKPMEGHDAAFVQNWTVESLKRCLTFDYLNYTTTASNCTVNIFSLNKFSNETKTRGQEFYYSLEQSGILSILMNTRTAMTVDIESVDFIDEGLKTRTLTFVRNGNEVSETQSIYQYEFEIVMRIKIVGQALDAPIRYVVTTERMSDMFRKSGLAIRNVISKE